MHFAFSSLVVFGLSLLSPAQTASAGEEPLRILQVLRENGYADVAVKYLEKLAERPEMPAEVRDVWDLEMSKSLSAAAADAYDEREYERLAAASQRHLAKFIREHPDHPAVASAITAWGENLGKQALGRLTAARNIAKKNKDLSAKLFSEARDELQQARDKFVQAQQYFQKQIDALPPPPKIVTRNTLQSKSAKRRAELNAELIEARFQTAMADYYLAQTYPDDKSGRRADALRQAAKTFDAIYQQERVGGGLTFTGLRAHLWHGKTAEELGDLQLAADIYDEVLVNAAEPGERTGKTGLEPLFAQVEYFRFLILAKQKPERFLAEAAAWLEKNRRRLQEAEGYQGVSLLMAKTIYETSQKGTALERSKGLAEALRILGEMSKIPSPHQQEAILMRRELLLASGKSDLEIGSFEEAVAMADAAAESGQWQQARQLYRKALDLADKSHKKEDPARRAAVVEAMIGSELKIAAALYGEGKLDACIEAVGRIVYKDGDKKIVRRESEAASQAAALAVAAALNRYVNAANDQKPDALAKLTEWAEFTESNWPDRPEADDARMARGQAKLVTGRVREAIDIFEWVNPKSERYAQAMYYAGQNYVRLYLVEKNKPADRRDEAQLAAFRERAIERLRAGLDVLGRRVESGRPLPDYFIDAQLLLAQVHAAAGEYEKAVARYQPLVDLIVAEKPQNLDRATIGVFLGAVRAYTALGQFDKAGRAADALIEIGPDAPQINDVLVRFAGSLDHQRQQALAAVAELQADGHGSDTATEENLAKVNALLGGILAKLAERKNLSAYGMVFVADGLNELGNTGAAGKKYHEFIERTQSDPQFAKEAEKAVSHVRARLVGLLRQENKHAEALEQVDRLIEANPRSLAPLMEKGRILESWADEDPRRYGDAVAHWVMLRNKLQRMKKKPDEYYEVMYNVAACLIKEAEASKDGAIVKDRANKAEKVLNAALILNPKLNGPDAVARYKVLLNKAITLQGRKPDKPERK
ncbi:MAG: hypothetical protein JW959_07835 [Pirellulales bacterium]|nr:hypothetical protein [Pirellulales bacterium]